MLPEEHRQERGHMPLLHDRRPRSLRVAYVSTGARVEVTLDLAISAGWSIMSKHASMAPQVGGAGSMPYSVVVFLGRA
jgi:hypothetical protein